MDSILSYLFSDGGYTPHGFCLAWDWRVLYTHIGADLLIALSYFAIPAMILIFLRRRKDPRLHQPAVLFVVFIAACGVSHLLSILTMFYPWYGAQGLVKLFTGLVSFVTAIALWKMLPEALKIPAPDTLMAALEAKEAEIAERSRAQAALLSKEAELAQQVKALRAVNEELREFAYAASHDLKSPTNTLSLWLQDFALECGARLEEEDRQGIADAEAILSRMRRLIDDILSYSRTVNLDELKKCPVDLNEVFANVLQDQAGEIGRARAHISVEPLPEVDGYPTLISIAAQNLIANALKFRSSDRPLKIKVSARQVLEPGEGVLLSITDNGVGIDQSHHQRIFKLFKRLHRADEYCGSGLGLALCRRVAVSHGGTIDVESAEGVGSTFRMFFPRREADVAKAA